MARSGLRSSAAQRLGSEVHGRLFNVPRGSNREMCDVEGEEDEIAFVGFR